MSTPPTPGPTTSVSWYSPKFSASALRSSRGSTRLGMIAERTTFWTALNPASAPPSTYSAHSGGLPAKVIAASPAGAAMSPICTSSSSLRRSNRSAIAPPSSDIAMSGTSSTAPSRPVRKADRVSR